ncbi:MAG TPA: hypothetical protein VGP64_14700 [Polyangia bacterium]|jgi:MYXO-CTERM domain-containing protein
MGMVDVPASYARRGARSAWKVALLGALVAAGVACAPEEAPPVDTQQVALTSTDKTGAGNLDILFVVDNTAGMAPMQAKLLAQIQGLFSGLQALPTGFPNTHVAVISSDMGAHSDHPEVTGCSETGDDGAFQAQPRGTCSDSGLVESASYVSDSDGYANYTGGDIAQIVQCILPLGESGCQFVHPLAAIARALGVDGAPAPMTNAGFLRPDAMLAIIVLAHEDDCSAEQPGNTALYSYNSGPDNLRNSLGPLTTYRCNEWGHLCIDPTGSSPASFNVPPESTPSDAQGPSSAPTLDLDDCTSNETGLLMPVKTFVDQIRALKPDPDHQIVVGAIAAPPTPYTIAWVPPPGGQDAGAGVLWPQIEHSCGPVGTAGTNPEATGMPTDGSFGDPGIRLTQFVKGFGANGLTTSSVCDASYANIMRPILGLVAADVSLPPLALDGGAVDAEVGAADGAAPGDGGAHHPDGSVPMGDLGLENGLRPGCNLCSVGASPTSGWGLSLLLIAPAVVRRRSRGAKKLT